MKYLRKNDCIMLAFSIVVFAVLQVLITERVLSSFWQLNLLIIGINIILAASLNLINGYTGQFSLGHAGFMAVGAYVGVVLTANFHMPFVVALIAGGIAAGFLGFLVGIPTLRLRGDYLAIATLGLGEIIRIVIMNIQYVGGAAGFKGIPHHTTFAWVFFIMLFTLFFIKNFVNSNHGRACLAIRENEIAAESMGVNTTKYKVMAFTIGAAFAGVAGGLFAHCFYLISPASFTFMQTFNIPDHGRHGRPRLDHGLDCRRLRRHLHLGRARKLAGVPHDHLRHRADPLDVLPSTGPLRLHGDHEYGHFPPHFQERGDAS